jgi:hypothetical protein
MTYRFFPVFEVSIPTLQFLVPLLLKPITSTILLFHLESQSPQSTIP